MAKKNRTCLDCGLLTIEGSQLTGADRLMLASRGVSAKMPANPERTRCFQDCWVDYDLSYVGDSFDGVLEELDANRNKCQSFIQYESGFTPAEHLEREEQRRRERIQLRIAKWGFLGGLIGALVGSTLPSFWKWLLPLLRRI